MPKTKVEVYDKDQLIYPFIESDHVTFSNGMKVSEMLDQSISMPTVVHEDLSFKVGVGDQDVSSAIVDSSVAEMTIKGKTYQNILPEPSTNVLTNNKEMFKVNEGLDPNVEIVDGVSKSAILSGNTLVNMCDDGVADASDIRRFTHNYTSNGGTFEQVSDGIKATTTQDNTWLIVGYDIRSQQKKMMTIGKKYYGVADVTVHKLTNSDSCSIAFRSQYSLRQSATLTRGRGIVQGVFNHGGVDANHGWLAVGTNGQKAVVGDSFTVHSMSVYEITDEEVNLSYEELANKYPVKCVGMQSVKMPVLKATGKNLFDGQIIRNACLGANGGYYNLDGAITFANMVYVKGLKNLRLSINNSYNSAMSMVYSFYDKDKNFMRREYSNYYFETGAKIPISDEVYYFRATFHTFSTTAIGDDVDIKIQLEESLVVTPYEPYKSNILSTPSDLELRGIGEVQDTLNCLTGEVTERIGKVVLDGSSPSTYIRESMLDTKDGNGLAFYVKTSGLGITIKVPNQTEAWLKCDKFATASRNELNEKKRLNVLSADMSYDVIRLVINKNLLTTEDVNGLITYLSSNPLTIQYPLATESIKTVDLSSSGNWEKIVLNGSENWNDFDPNYGCAYTWLIGKAHGFSNVFAEGFSTVSNYANAPLTISGTPNNSAIWLSIGKSIATLDQFKHYLSQNPVAVWYQTTTHLDSTQVKQPIFFKDGHIQLSSGADNSLIPTLDYQAKTSNSYVMDLMKTNTKYTMKAKSASGTFTIDGTSYGAGTNGTFTTPSSMTNKFLVMSNNANEEIMILEGDVTSKTIPYFKGIKSAFEDESKIEVLSTGKNLFDIEKVARALHSMGNRETIKIENGYKIKALDHGTHNRTKLQLKPNTTYIASFTLAKDPSETLLNFEIYTTVGSSSSAFYVVEEGSFVRTFTTDKTGVVEVRMDGGGNGYTYYTNIQIEESPNVTSYEPYKSNNTKIPLLSPLRSLSDGACDELIIDRENNKAKIIQRVGRVILDGKEDWSTNSSFDTTETKFFYLPNSRIPNTWGRIFSGWRCITSNRFASDTGRTSAVNQKIEWISGGDGANGMIQILIKKERLSIPDVSGFKQWLSQNPVMVYYELETPVITEVDLEGFPYIYKDGHIFLNSEIVPTTEIIYSVNQCQQISASNEDIIRHEKELTYLQKLIAQYVQVDYESALLSLKA